MELILVQDIGPIRLITLNHENKNNPFSRDLEKAIMSALKAAEDDDQVKALVVTGGADRSFSAGGDFNEVKNLSSTEEVDDWIDRVLDLYISVLKVTKPTVAAVDGYAIGMGFQFSMMFDRRFAASSASYIMPELKHGIGCSVGAAILTYTSGFTRMQDIIYSCETIAAQTACDIGLVNEIVNPGALLERALDEATKLANYPEVAFRKTKGIVNARFINILNDARNESKLVHRSSFAARGAQSHFAKVLGQKYMPNTHETELCIAE